MRLPWFRGEIEVGESPLVQLLKSIVIQEETNAANGNTDPVIFNQQVKAYCESWLEKGYLLDKPNSKTIKTAMAELGYRLTTQGRWIKS